MDMQLGGNKCCLRFFLPRIAWRRKITAPVYMTNESLPMMKIGTNSHVFTLL